MHKKTESIKKTEKEKWKYFFKMKKWVKGGYYIHKYFVNPDMNKIKEIWRHGETIINCPAYLDDIILRYLDKNGRNSLISWRLIDIINNMFTECDKDCPFWKEWLGYLEEVKKSYNIKEGFCQMYDIGLDMIKTHDNILNLYEANNW